MRLRTHLYRLTFYLLTGYGFLYFSYKWLIPTAVNTDFVEYYGMIVHPFDFQAAPSPWVYRQANALFAHLLWRAHVYYPGVIQFSDPHYDQRIFFAALFTNFLAVVLTAWLVSLIVEGWLGRGSHILPLFGGILCFCSFLLQETTLTGQADGLSWTLVALCYLLYQQHRLRWFALVVLFSILQREILPIIFCTLAASTALLLPRLPGTEPEQHAPNERRYQLQIAAVSVIAFAAYLLLRHIIHAPGNEYQADLPSLWHGIRDFRLTLPYINQVILGQNLLLLLCGMWLLLYKRLREYTIRMVPLLITCVVLILVSIITHIGLNAARMLALLTPLVAAEITFALAKLDGKQIPATRTSNLAS